MDSLSAVAHVLANHKTFSIKPDKFTLGGESSGATIALILNHLFRDAGMGDKVAGVIVGTPTISDVRKYATPDMSPYPSMREAGITPLLNWEKLKWFDTFKWMSLSSQPLGPDGRVLGKVSYKEKKLDVEWFADIMEAKRWDGLARTWVGTAEVDPLRDEGEAYAEKIRKEGNEVVVKRYEGVPHGFMHMDRVLSQGREFVDDVVGEIRRALWPNGVEEEKKEDEDAKPAEEKTAEKEAEKEDEEMKDAPDE